MKTNQLIKENFRVIFTALILPVLALSTLIVTQVSKAGSDEGGRKTAPRQLSPLSDPNLPSQYDVRGGTPRGLELRQPTAVQLRALGSLQDILAGSLSVRYNGLTATPMNISNPNSYLTGPNSAPPEQIARDFVRQWREIFRFDDADMDNLKLVSRATTAEGTTVMLFQQQAGGFGVYHGEVLVNVNRAGQIINVGGDSFPRLNINNAVVISPALAISAAASAMNVTGFTPNSLGSAQILTTYGDLPPEYVTGAKFARSVFSDDISVQTVVFPLGDNGRLAYKFNLAAPQYHGIVWQNIVDAQTGDILKRTSLTSYFGEPGGGNSVPRKGTFRPDVQNAIEGNNSVGSAQGKVFDTQPVTLSKVGGVGRAVRTGSDPGNYQITQPPIYDPEAVNTNPFRYSLVLARHEDPLPFQNPAQGQGPLALTSGLLGQVTRGFPDAAHPSSSSPFGWFYLPTDSAGAEITTASTTTGTTRTAGYTMSAEAQSRNLAANSPTGNKAQPFSADLTPITNTTLPDGRILGSVFQSRYTEGNNVTVSDDRANDNDATRGVRGYSANRQFTAAYYDYYANYEFLGPDATGGGTASTTPVTYPPSSDSDVYPDTVNLFYFNNVEHDYLYSIGFTEPFWNFQFDNFGKGGAGNDGIVAEVQDGSGTDNANMSSPAEGSSPRMQMYLFTDAGFRRSDGDLDWDVVAHEHYHGVSNRSAAKGGDSCLGTPLVGESGGMGEGWSDSIAASLSDDDSEGEYVTGQYDNAIRRLAYTNYRYSYGSINDQVLNVRKNTNSDVIGPDANAGGTPYEVHDIGEVWAAALWDMRELMIVKQNVNGTYPGIFFDGGKRLGSGSTFYIGDRAVQSVDTVHPINYRQSFGTDDSTSTPSPFPAQPTMDAARDIVRPGVIAAENASNPNRNGPVATAVVNGGKLADKTVLRGLQLAPCNPTFVDMRDSMLAADREMTGGENQAIIWRALASHGVGANATSTGKTNGTLQQGGPAVIVEDFTVPQGVTDCETLGPLPAPQFSLSNTANNSVTVAVTAVSGAADYVIARSTNPNGPFTTIATVTGTTFTDNDNNLGLVLGQTYYYQVHARRSAYCVGTAATQSITITMGAPLSPAPSFAGVGQVSDPRTGFSLILTWSPASSTNQGANIVYDIYRVINVSNADFSVAPPTFTPDASNRIAQGQTGTTFTDRGLTLGQQYYYIVRARDTANGKIDTLNVGNTVTKFNAPSTNLLSTTPFALENFETTTADSRFAPPLLESATANRSLPFFQRVPSADLTGGGSSLRRGDSPNALTGAMFAPDFDPGNAGQGGPSDFNTQIGPFPALPPAAANPLTRSSFLEFDHRFSTEASFDGAVVEVVLGAPGAAAPYPDNVATFDMDDYIVQNGYDGNLNGTIQGVTSSPLLGRRAFTGTKGLSHVKIALGDFAPGGAKNPSSLPVYVRFRMTSDAGTFVDGWYIDNVVINNYALNPTAASAPISGQVRDAYGRPLAGITLRLQNPETGIALNAVTNRKGVYNFPDLPVGQNYIVTPITRQYTFDPGNSVVNHLDAEGNINFTATLKSKYDSK
jgi:Zn-dependent metalloprotease